MIYFRCLFRYRSNGWCDEDVAFLSYEDAYNFASVKKLLKEGMLQTNPDDSLDSVEEFRIVEIADRVTFH